MLSFLADLRAQDLIEDAVFCMGTTTIDAQNRDWAYLLWQTTDAGLVMGRKFAIYAKDGDANSANPYERKAIAVMQTDPLIIQALLNRATNLGDDLVELEGRIDKLFLSIMPDGSLTLPEKISAVIRGSLDHTVHFGNLVLLGRIHPGINLCIGYAHAEMISSPGKTTFEIREYDLAKDQDIGVVGRVTVEAGAPTVLPAPGSPVRVPEANPKGDLNVKLRWATPDALRRLSLLNFGFNVYRITESYALANGFDVTPPTPAQIGALAATNANVKKINELPALKTKDFTAADVANLVADPATFFVADDNDRYKIGGQAFEDGQVYYYFATAVDVLLRDGLVSPGTAVTICDRLPPDAPRGILVENDYSYNASSSNTKQVLKVTWKQHTNTTQDTVLSYYVYRWTNATDAQKFAIYPLTNRIAGPLAHVPGSNYNCYVDDGPGSPQMTNDQGKTFWYTVRGEDDSVCGGNLSAHSYPAFGVLRDRTGPVAPTGMIDIRCCKPEVAANGFVDITVTNFHASDTTYYEVECHRTNAGVAWAEFYAFNTNSLTNFIGKAWFAPGSNPVSFAWSAKDEQVVGGVPFYCRAGSTDGKVSAWKVNAVYGSQNRQDTRHVLFSAGIDCERVIYGPAVLGDCPSHSAHPPGGIDIDTGGVEINLNLSPGTKQYRLYRRVDFGPLTLIEEGEADYDDVTMITITNTALPANPGFLCYYGQLGDEHGNWSALTLISDNCIPFFTMFMPKPLLSPLSPDGTLLSPRMTIRWFCPPYGVERFQVWIGAKGVLNMPNSLGNDLSTRIGAMEQNVSIVIGGASITNDFGIYQTRRIGPNFGDGAMFEVDVNIVLGKTYYVFIKPVGKDGQPADDSRNSNAEKFKWHIPAAPVGPMIPWPARALPPVSGDFNSSIVALRLPNAVHPGVGISIGSAKHAGTPEDPPYNVLGQADPASLLFTNDIGETILPVVAYRYQVTNGSFNAVSGDLIQVSPLMEQIAHSFTNQLPYGPITKIYDPFIALQGITESLSIIYLLDTQPVVANASYVYLLVRMDADGEIKEVIPTNPVEVTP